ncbi:thiosulfate dehydrogenase [quinone] large subunit [Jatrophihabitans endophyticus]|uniref:Thiosulfate dehydrogenase [quinone] large subunit n=2 Tax=Jatrophihabitans endophyticus TaxID=1206085 RepID=A0A1M5CJH3_9ACTN|nr:DoxX family membrane protein [Jatrophihabitans endophyticus]SHF54757.1 thiosulfate dehydrogenase [quinone] large subunit [Jatrophihabitans endophyticus]
MTTDRSIISTSTSHEVAEAPGSMLSHAGARALAVLRIATGFVFLWAFLDKTFGLGYSTESAKAWIHGGSPTDGFLSHVEVGPLQSLFHTMAGTWYADWLFMLGMLGVGAAVIAGVGVRLSAAAGALIMALMWLAEFPLAQHTSAGAPSGSVNPLVDYHIVYAVALIVVALTYAGDTWGLGRSWARLPIVRRFGWLR